MGLSALCAVAKKAYPLFPTKGPPTKAAGTLRWEGFSVLRVPGLDAPSLAEDSRWLLSPTKARGIFPLQEVVAYSLAMKAGANR